MKIIALVQVRMGSTRLPGKALADVSGRPLLWHLINRLRFAKRIDQVAIATSVEPQNNVIREFAATENVPCFSGSETDLIQRLLNALRHFNATAFVRITGDCPLVDPEIVDEIVDRYTADPQLDYVSNVLPPTYPEGLDTELYPLSLMARLDAELSDPFNREWFPLYVWNHQNGFRCANLQLKVDLSSLRWTVDYPEDLEFVRAVLARLYREGEVFVMRDILRLLEREPALRAINSRHSRNEGYEIAVANHKMRAS